MPSVRYNVNSLTSCLVEWSKSMSRDTKRMNQTIRYAQQKLEPSLMHKMFFLNLYYVIVKSRKAITEILFTKYTMNKITNAG